MGRHAKTTPLCVRDQNISMFGCEEALDPTLAHLHTLQCNYTASSALEALAGGELSYKTPLFSSHFRL